MDWDSFLTALGETFFIVGFSIVLSGVLGLVLGIALAVTRRGGLLSSPTVYTVLNVVVNIVRPIPFIIFIVAIQPLTVSIFGTYLGPTAATFALALSAAFAVSRIVEQNLVAVEPGVLEAARAAGASPIGIIFTVLIPEGLGPLILGYTFLFVAIVDMSAQVGIVGGGGLGDYAITYGVQRSDYEAMYISVLAIVVIVQVGQFVGNRLARVALRR